MKPRSEKIILRGEYSHQSEDKATAVLKPGHVVELVPAGGVKPQSVAKKKTVMRVATADIFTGKGIEDAYAVGENVYFTALKSGDRAQLRIAAAGAAIVRGDQLELKGDGTVSKLTDGNPVAEALEAIDNSAGATEAFINTEIV